MTGKKILILLLFLCAVSVHADLTLVLKPGIDAWLDSVGGGGWAILEIGPAPKVPGLFLSAGLGGFMNGNEGLRASNFSLGGGIGYRLYLHPKFALVPALQTGFAFMHKSSLANDAARPGFFFSPALDLRLTLQKKLALGLSFAPWWGWNVDNNLTTFNILMVVTHVL